MARPKTESGTASPPFHVRSIRVAGTLNLILSGELDASKAPQLQAAILADKKECACLVIDLTDVTFVDSIGLGVLDSARKLSRRTKGFELYFIPPAQKAVRKVVAFAETEKALI